MVGWIVKLIDQLVKGVDHLTDKDEQDRLQHERMNHIGRQLQQAARDFNGRALRGLRQRGHTNLGAAHLNLLPHLEVGGTRLTTLAEQAGMTKQAASQLVGELERQGYLSRQPDPSDGRAQRVTFTEKGLDFLQDAADIKREIAAEYRARLGPELWAHLDTALTLLLASEN